MQTPLHYAAKNKNPKPLKLLVDSGASIEAEDKKKERAVHFAARNENTEILRYLAINNAELDPKSDHN